MIEVGKLYTFRGASKGALYHTPSITSSPTGGYISVGSLVMVLAYASTSYGFKGAPLSLPYIKVLHGDDCGWAFFLPREWELATENPGEAKK